MSDINLSITSLVAPLASNIGFTPVGAIAATDVQSAIAEVATDAATAASTTTSGIVELATDAEALARTDAVRAVTPANLSQFTTLARHNGARLLPTGAVSQTLARQDISSITLGLLVSGRQMFVLCWLPAGTINSITFFSGSTAAVSPTNQWFSIYDINRNKLAVTADDTTTAWASNTAKTLTISGGYTVATEGLYYLGIMVAAATPPTVIGDVTNTSAINLLPPIANGFDGTNLGLTTPATAPATAAALTTNAGIAYAYVS